MDVCTVSQTSSLHDPYPIEICRNYVDYATAARENLTFSSGDHFIVRADFQKTLSASGPGRDSVRLRSNNQYTTSVTVSVSSAWTVQSN